MTTKRKFRTLVAIALLGLTFHAVADDNCAKEGVSIAVHPKAPKCCAGLELMPPAPGILGSAGKCSKKSAALISCETKVKQIEQIVASKEAQVEAELAKKIQDIVRAVPASTNAAKKIDGINAD
jgi:hypothetical protein